MYQESSKELWDYLKETYDQQENLSHIYNLKQELVQIKQNNRDNSEYLAELKKKLQELKTYLPPSTDLKEIQKRAERDEIFLYLSGLDASYESIRSHILMSADLPSFTAVVSMINREESRRRGMGGSQAKSSEEHEAQAFASKHYKPPFRNQKPPNPRLKGKQAEENRCSHCKKTGHDKDSCWFLHPHLRPAHWQERGEQERKGEKKGTVGGFEKKKGSKGYVAKGLEGDLSPTAPDVAEGSGSNGSSQDPMQQMFAQFAAWYAKQNNNYGISLNSINLNLNDQIILDSGATDHMFCNEHFLTNLDLTKNTKHVLVADGTKVICVG